MADVNLTATTRTEFGKGASRRLRRAGSTPAVLYGHGTDPVHLALPARETFLALRQPNVLLQITVEGDKTPFLALPKQVQRHAILHSIDHIDLVLIKAGEKVTVDVPLTFTGEAERGTLVNHELNNLSVLAPAASIPTEFVVSIEGLSSGSHLTVGDIPLPEGVEAAVPLDVVVVSVGQAPVQDLGDEPEAAAAEGAVAAE
ncbi:50S ribosomal protein L25/general stress protein Ctc [Tessaracoccus sp. MC1679]|uniref:50S ribosomal protein L25/general stress protein Ctc n=1 Tax=unclassified Tessaracoccus TaxID=2635419 RepID=UPI0016028CAF|nr:MULTISPECIES: 50S ribosomal protein L25/general stress protein Ctc [unclassified Tessaracoccus]MBB1511876.1 50S ribosomal protein L25/general stress protein Ctc [Tessaracoccus sp. MC1627]MBB1514437.1 50S ribosomal protein L25/general stress protein Ctc [Tessaracoccus sp. MC1679]